MSRTLRNTIAVLGVTLATALAIHGGVTLVAPATGTGSSTYGTSVYGVSNTSSTRTLTCPATGCTASSCHGTSGASASGGGITGGRGFHGG